MSSFAVRCLGLSIGLALTGTIAAPAAGADRAGTPRSDAAQLAEELTAVAHRLRATDREYTRTAEVARRAHASLSTAQETSRRAQDSFRRAQRHLVGVAVRAYTDGGTTGPPDDALRSGPLASSPVMDQYRDFAVGGARQALDRFAARQADRARAMERLKHAELRAAAAVRRLAARRASLRRAEAHQRAVLHAVRAPLLPLVVIDLARQVPPSAGPARRRQVPPSVRRKPSMPSVPAPPSTPPTTAPVWAPLDGVWACIRQKESGNNYRAPGGGAYQIIETTWHSLGQPGSAEQASPLRQDLMALALQQRSGWGQWTTARSCGAV